jgi:hypothetical protein
MGTCSNLSQGATGWTGIGDGGNNTGCSGQGGPIDSACLCDNCNKSDCCERDELTPCPQDTRMPPYLGTKVVQVERATCGKEHIIRTEHNERINDLEQIVDALSTKLAEVQNEIAVIHDSRLARIANILRVIKDIRLRNKELLCSHSNQGLQIGNLLQDVKGLETRVAQLEGMPTLRTIPIVTAPTSPIAAVSKIPGPEARYGQIPCGTCKHRFGTATSCEASQFCLRRQDGFVTAKFHQAEERKP